MDIQHVLQKQLVKNAVMAWSHWRKFWFEAEYTDRARRFRFVFGLLLFCFYFLRSADLELFFGENGILPLDSYESVMQAPLRFSLLTLSTSSVWLWTLNITFLLSLLGMALGAFPKVLAFCAFVIDMSFIHRNYAGHFGADFISVFFLLYLCLMAPWKSDWIWEKTKSKSKAVHSESWTNQFASVGFRLAQIQLCVIYFYSGLEKLKGPSWWAGQSLWMVLANPQLARWNFSFLADFPTFLTVGTYLTLLWEIYFPVLVWVSKIRPAMLLFGAALHIGIGITIKIPFFSSIMISTYLLFWDPKWQKRH